MNKYLLLAFIFSATQLIAQDGGSINDGESTINPEIENLGGFKPDIDILNTDYQGVENPFGNTETSPGSEIEITDVSDVRSDAIPTRSVAEITYSLYPNPATDHVIIDLNNRTQGTLQVLNLVGQILYSQPIDNSLIRVSLDNIEPGVYFISVTSGEERVIKKLKVQ